MDIEVPLRDLGAVDATALRDAILAQEDSAWREDRSRQESFYVHDQTRSIVMIALDDDRWPVGAVTRGAGWRRIADAGSRWLMSNRSTPYMNTVSAQPVLCELGLAPKAFEQPDLGIPVGYAFHMNALKYADYLRGFSTARGVTHHLEHVTDIEVADDGRIAAVATRSGRRLEADLFIDSTGFAAILIEKTLGVGWADFSPWLLCDRALVLRGHGAGRRLPGTAGVHRPVPERDRRRTAHRALPLRRRHGTSGVSVQSSHAQPLLRDSRLHQHALLPDAQDGHGILARGGAPGAHQRPAARQARFLAHQAAHGLGLCRSVPAGPSGRTAGRAGRGRGRPRMVGMPDYRA